MNIVSEAVTLNKTLWNYLGESLSYNILCSFCSGGASSSRVSGAPALALPEKCEKSKAFYAD